MRRYRRYLPYPVLAVALAWLRPIQAGGSVGFDLALDGTGVLLALAGAVMRLWAWGSNSGPETIGLRRRGPYAMMRHPLRTRRRIAHATVPASSTIPTGNPHGVSAGGGCRASKPDSTAARGANSSAERGVKRETSPPPTGAGGRFSLPVSRSLWQEVRMDLLPPVAVHAHGRHAHRQAAAQDRADGGRARVHRHRTRASATNSSADASAAPA